MGFVRRGDARLINAGALDLIIDTVEAGATSGEARSWWVSYLAQKANAAGVELADLAITPAQVAEVVGLVKEGKLTNKLARAAVDGVLDGEGTVAEVIKARGLEVVRDDAAIEKAVDEALAANPRHCRKDSRRKRQGRRCHRWRGDESTRGKADPALVNKLIAEKTK